MDISCGLCNFRREKDKIQINSKQECIPVAVAVWREEGVSA